MARLHPSIFSTQKFQILSKKGVVFFSHTTGSSVIGMPLVPAVMLTGIFKIRIDGKKKKLSKEDILKLQDVDSVIYPMLMIEGTYN